MGGAQCLEKKIIREHLGTICIASDVYTGHSRCRQAKPVCLGSDYELPGNAGIWGDRKQMDNCEEGKLYAPWTKPPTSPSLTLF